MSVGHLGVGGVGSCRGHLSFVPSLLVEINCVDSQVRVREQTLQLRAWLLMRLLKARTVASLETESNYKLIIGLSILAIFDP